MRAVWFLALLLVAGAAHAQTTSPSTTPSQLGTPAVHSTTAKHKTPAKTAAKKTSAKKSPAKTPVVSPKHGAVPRKPVHPGAAVVSPKGPVKAVAKPVVTAAKPPAKPAAPAKPPIPPDEGTVTHLHLPRYVSLRSDEVNMRAGPANRFPILWVYKRKELPVKIEREFDIWRLVEDMDGIKGWVHQATITGRRTFVVTGTAPANLRADGNDDAEVVAVLKPGVVGRIKSCDAGAAWCKVQAGDYSGWLPRTSFWGTDPGEAVAP